MTETLTIRPAAAADAATLVALTRDLAAFHGNPGAASVTAADVLRDGFGRQPLIWCWLAEDAAGTAVGYIQLCEGYAAWRGHPILVVSNLWVAPHLRGGGLGRRLLAEAAAFARAQGIERMELHVVESNPARHFYERLGFRILPDLRCRIEEAELGRLAGSRRPPGGPS